MGILGRQNPSDPIGSTWFVIPPPIIEHKGIGSFTSGDVSFQSEFQIRLYPARTSIETNHDDQHGDFSRLFRSSDEPYTFHGVLADGRPISCERLGLRRLTNGTYWFTPQENIEIGSRLDKPIRSASFPLLGFFEGNLSLQDADWHISLSSDMPALDTLKNTSEVWGIPLEGLSLQLSHPEATSEQYFAKVLEFLPLLSLPSGINVTFNRQILSWDTETTVEIWLRGTGGRRGLDPILASAWYQRYLDGAVPIWNTLSSKDQKLIRVAILYLNASAHGYVEDKILSVHIAWEMLANVWTEGDLAGLPEIDSLKAKLKQAYKEWRVNNPEVDPDGFLFGRVSESLKWDKAIKKIEQLAREYNIDDTRIGTDFRRLKELRDSVGHNGLMPQDAYSLGKDSSPYKLLGSTQFALRVLLLKRFGYTGLVASAKDNWRTFVDIEDADFEP